MDNPMQLKAKIKNIAKQHNITAQSALQVYMMEIFLEQISISKYRDNFILKGGLLIASIVGIERRTTLNIDGTFKSNKILNEELIGKFVDHLNTINKDTKSKVRFEIKSIKIIHEVPNHKTYRVFLNSYFYRIVEPFRLDISTEKTISPFKRLYNYKKILSDGYIKVLAITIEVILAEKLESIISKGVKNHRMNDLYDVYMLMKLCLNLINFDLLISALIATSKNRDTFNYMSNLPEIINDISNSDNLKSSWNHFQETHFYAKGIEYKELMGSISDISKEVVNK
jgi:predicted nucleotidyltransferase component of viral defense system